MEQVIYFGFICLVLLVLLYDVLQKKHAVLRNFPVIGHMRYLLESVGPELRQYITTNNDEERPFSRDQRRWVYASAKLQNNYFGFGSDNQFEQASDYLLLKHAAFPYQPSAESSRRIRCRARRSLGSFGNDPRHFDRHLRFLSRA